MVIIYIGGSVGGVKFSSWMRGPVLKAVCLQCMSLVAFGKVEEGGGKRSRRKCNTCNHAHLLFVWKVISKRRRKMA